MSARSSRISHPQGARFFLIHEWAARDFGFAAAAVLGALDFLDRAQPEAGQILASRARLVADLQAIVGRDAVDAALARLISMGWVDRHVLMTVGTRNLQTSYSFSLRADVVSSYTQRFSRLPDFRMPGKLDSGMPASALQAGNQEPSKQEEKENAAACVRLDRTQKRRNKRASGIVTWYASEECKAKEIEEQHGGEEIANAVAALVARRKQAVPGLVEEEIERQQQSQKREEARLAQLAGYSLLPERPDAEQVSARLALLKATLANGGTINKNAIDSPAIPPRGG